MAPSPPFEQRIQEIFEQAIDLPQAKRESFLDQFKLNHEEQAYLKELFQHFESETTLVPEQSRRKIEDALQAKHEQVITHQQFGAYRITKKLGAGGMGAVFLGKRADDVYEKNVAIKIMGNRLESPQALAQFRNERQILAMLQHPFIARLLDGGTTQQGRIYLVMDYVQGQTISDYVTQCNLSIRARLQLVLKLCEAVQYAHQNMVIHGDLKPSNILVNQSGDPILLDFGIAQIMDSQHVRQSKRTLETLRFSPKYASPEQIRGEPLTAASDVYALGILLHELLIGIRPYELPSESLHAMRSFLESYLPALPSSLLQQLLKTSNRPSTERPFLHAKHIKTLKGDLDSIILKALAIKPSHRYATVADFSGDLKAYLQGFLPKARPAKLHLRFGKHLKRHALVYALGFGLFTFGCFHLLQNHQKNLHIRQENKRFKEAFVLMKEMVSIEASSAGIQDDPITIAELLRLKAQKALDFELQDPTLKYEYLLTLTESLLALGMVDQASQTMNQMAQIKSPKSPETERHMARHSFLQAALAYFQANYDGVEPLLNKAGSWFEANNHLQSLADVWLLRGKNARAQGKRKASIPMFEKALDLRGRDLPNHSRKIASVHFELGYTHNLLGEFSDASNHLSKALSIHEAGQPAITPLAIRIHQQLFTSLNRQSHIEASKPHLEQAIVMTKRLFGYRHKDVAINLKKLGTLQLKMGEVDNALSSYLESAELHRNMLGNHHPSLAGIHHNIGEALRYARRWEKAAEHYQYAISINQSMGPKKQQVSLGYHYLRRGAVLNQLKRYEEAREHLCQAKELFLNHANKPSRAVSLTQVYLAENSLADGENRQALQSLKDSLPHLQARDAKEHQLATRLLKQYQGP